MRYRNPRIASIALLCTFGLYTSAIAQTNSPANAANPPLKEVIVAPSAFSVGEPVPAWVDPVTMPETSSTEPVIFRLVDTQLLAARTPIVFVHRAVAINNAGSLTAAGQLPIPFAAEYQRLQLHAVNVIRGGERQDRTKSATIRFVQRETGLEQGVYRGLVTALVIVNDLRVGDTIEYIYSLHGHNPVFAGKYIDGASWDQGFPTEYRRVVLNHPLERKVAWRLIGDRQPAPLMPKESATGGMRKLVFEERGVAAAPPEPMTPSDYSALAWLQFSEFKDWNEVATWAADLFKVNGNHSDELRSVVEKLRLQPSPSERVTAALEFVQSEIRYFSIALGESSHRPAPPDVVLSRRYGDCKDKSILLLTLLKELGIQAKPVLLQLGQRKGLEKILPSPLAFNHVIVQATVDGSDYYLDPTRLGQHGRLSRMGEPHAGAQILIVDPETHAPTAIPASRPERYMSVLAEKATLATMDGDADLEVRETWTGSMAERNRSMFAQVSHDQIRNAMAGTVERLYPGAKAIRPVEIQDDPANNTLSAVALYRVPKFATERDGYWVLRYKPTNMAGVLPTPNSATRKDPVSLPGFQFKIRYTFEAKLPGNVSVIADPLSKSMRNKHFAYAVTASFRGNRAKSEINLDILADRIETADVAEYIKDLRDTNNIPIGAIVVPKSAIRSASRGSAPADFAVQVRTRLQESIKRMTAAINSGKISGKDLAAMYCDRASAYSVVGRSGEAMQDLTRAMKIAPETPSLFACRAEIYFNAGQFEKSVSDYSHAIDSGEAQPRAFYLRGISKFYTGNLEDAAADLTRASEAEDHALQMYSDMWTVWTLKRLGRAVPEVIMKRAAAESHGEWPKPALAMLTGSLTPEELLKIIDEKTGEDRYLALAEGYFYIGQHYLAQGNKAQAIEYFEKARRQNMIMYVEYQAAKFELATLKKNVTPAPPARSSTQAAKPAPAVR